MIVLDTHAWIWWSAAPERLSDAAREAIDAAEQVGVCSISCWEVAMLVLRSRIELDREIERWIRQALAHPRASGLPLTPEIATRAALLEQESFPGDPADRIIYATARHHGAALVSRDGAIGGFDPPRVIW